MTTKPQKATSLCSFCPKLSRTACPVSDVEKNESTTPWGKMTAMKMVEDQKLPMTKETMALPYKCTECRASEVVCEMHNPVAATLDYYRVKAFQAGLAPDTVFDFAKRFERHNNPYDFDLQERLLHRLLPDLSVKTSAVYFPGCAEIANDLKTTEKSLSLLESISSPGSRFSLYTEQLQCCGYPLFSSGDWDNFVDLAEVNSHALSEYDLIVTGAPICLYTMETLYRKAGFPIVAKMKHITEILGQMKKGREKESPSPFGERAGVRGRPTVTYHDPCFLGRYRKGYETPRKLIESVTGKPPLEFARHHEQSYCCGGAGLLPVSFPETADGITKNRIEEFETTGADLLVTSCPICVERFRKFGVKAKSLIDFLVE